MEKEKKTKKKTKKDELVEMTEINIELETKLLRIQAEFQNYIRRSNEEMRKMLKYSNEELVLELLPIIDNFERALSMDDDLSDETVKFLEGFVLIHQNLIDKLKLIEVEKMDCINKPFDPNYHEAILTESNKKQEKGIILEVMQKGYMLKDKVLRPAMVKVNEYEKEREI